MGNIRAEGSIEEALENLEPSLSTTSCQNCELPEDDRKVTKNVVKKTIEDAKFPNRVQKVCTECGEVYSSSRIE